MSDHDVTKLPRWAQMRISKLESDIDYAHAKLMAGPEESIAVADPFSDAPRPLGADPHVEFRLPSGKLRVSVQHGKLYVSSDSNAIAIQPASGNCVYVYASEWR